VVNNCNLKKGRRYNWFSWFKNREVKLFRNKDYNGLDHTFAQYSRKAAKRHGYLISVTVCDGYIVIKVHGTTDPCPEVHNNRYRKKNKDTT
jgi:hypothetical protein